MGNRHHEGPVSVSPSAVGVQVLEGSSPKGDLRSRLPLPVFPLGCAIQSITLFAPPRPSVRGRTRAPVAARRLSGEQSPFHFAVSTCRPLASVSSFMFISQRRAAPADQRGRFENTPEDDRRLIPSESRSSFLLQSCRASGEPRARTHTHTPATDWTVTCISRPVPNMPREVQIERNPEVDRWWTV